MPIKNIALHFCIMLWLILKMSLISGYQEPPVQPSFGSWALQSRRPNWRTSRKNLKPWAEFSGPTSHTSYRKSIFENGNILLLSEAISKDYFQRCRNKFDESSRFCHRWLLFKNFDLCRQIKNLFWSPYQFLVLKLTQ